MCKAHQSRGGSLNLHALRLNLPNSSQFQVAMHFKSHGFGLDSHDIQISLSVQCMLSSEWIRDHDTQVFIVDILDNLRDFWNSLLRANQTS